MIPHCVAFRLTHPVVVHAFNQAELTRRMARGEVLFLQRGGAQQRLRAIAHVAVQAYQAEDGDRLLRRGRKYPLLSPPLPAADDVPLPVQCTLRGRDTALCFGDRIVSRRQRRLIDPMATVSWPRLHVGDTVLVTPTDGDWCLDRGGVCTRGRHHAQRQSAADARPGIGGRATAPAHRRQSMLGMRVRLGGNLSFGASCGPIEALRGDYDGDSAPVED